MLRDLFSLFPAHAGVILYLHFTMDDNLSFPRTCGGDPMRLSFAPRMTFFSPHMRG